METNDFLIEVIKETERLLSELFTSGFLSAHDSTLEEMERMSETCMQCGLIFAGEKLKGLSEEVRANRHRISRDFVQGTNMFCSLYQYVSLCEKKLELDKVIEHL